MPKDGVPKEGSIGDSPRRREDIWFLTGKGRYTKDGEFLAIRSETTANVGAYLSNFSTATSAFLRGTLMSGSYKTPMVYMNLKTVFTNTAPADAYRGAGCPYAGNFTFPAGAYSLRGGGRGVSRTGRADDRLAPGRGERGD